MGKERKIIWRHVELKSKNEDESQDSNYADLIQNNPFLMQMQGMSPNTLYTPFGIIPSDNEFVFDTWIGTTNFDLDDETIEVIDNTEGVEMFRPFSPYTFLLVIGQQFSFSNVRREIERQLCYVETTEGEVEELEQSPPEPSSPSFEGKMARAINKLTNKLSKNYQYWAVLCLPNLRIKCLRSNEITAEFNENLILFDELVRLVGGGHVERSPNLVG